MARQLLLLLIASLAVKLATCGVVAGRGSVLPDPPQQPPTTTTKAYPTTATTAYPTTTPKPGYKPGQADAAAINDDTDAAIDDDAAINDDTVVNDDAAINDDTAVNEDDAAIDDDAAVNEDAAINDDAAAEDDPHHHDKRDADYMTTAAPEYTTPAAPYNPYAGVYTTTTTYAPPTTPKNIWKFKEKNLIYGLGGALKVVAAFLLGAIVSPIITSHAALPPIVPPQPIAYDYQQPPAYK